MRRPRIVALAVLLLLVGVATILLAPSNEYEETDILPAVESKVDVRVAEATPIPPPDVEKPAPAVIAEPVPDPSPVLHGSPKVVPAAPPEKPSSLPFASGRVEDSDGHPIAAVAVIPRQTRTWGYGKDGRVSEEPVPLGAPDAVLARTSDEGTFAFAEIPPDFLCLLFVKPGWAATELRALSSDRAENQDLVVVLEPGRPPSHHVPRARPSLVPSPASRRAKGESVINTGFHLAGGHHYVEGHTATSPFKPPRSTSTPTFAGRRRH